MSSGSGFKTYETTALRIVLLLDGTFRQDGPFKCTVVGIGRDGRFATGHWWPEFKYVKFAEELQDPTIYPVHESAMGAAAVKPGERSEVILSWNGREYAAPRVATKPATREVATLPPAMGYGF